MASAMIPALVALALVLALVILVIGARRRFEADSDAREAALLAAEPSDPAPLVEATELEALPEPVRRWLAQSGVVGRPRARAVRLRQRGRMRPKADGPWMEFSARQLFTPATPGFVWRARVRAFPGLLLFGRDSYVEGRGRMTISLWSLISVVDAAGAKIDQGTALRFLSETIWMPSAALEPMIRWQAVDADTARAELDWGGQRVEGLFRFDRDGQPRGFEARRYRDEELEDWIITIPAEATRSFDGVRVPGQASVTWGRGEAAQTWLELEITELELR